jgi:DNA primase
VAKCHARCSVDDILAALGLSRTDLVAEPRQAKQGEAVTAEYPYPDEAGQVLHGKWRYWPKRFIQWRPTPDGGKEFNLDGVRRVLFHLPQLQAAKARGENQVYLVEGEEDVLALERAGVVATTWTDGAWQPGQKPKWRTEYSQTLTGMHVAIVQDRDDNSAGQHTARDIAAELKPYAANVKIVEAAEGKDARDHLDAGPSNNDFVAVPDEAPQQEEEPYRPNIYSQTDDGNATAYRPRRAIPKSRRHEAMVRMGRYPTGARPRRPSHPRRRARPRRRTTRKRQGRQTVQAHLHVSDRRIQLRKAR